MIRGIGLDAVNIDRCKKWRDSPKLLSRFFHPDELEEARKKGSMEIHSLAARFAAKEAFGKALGTGLIGFSLNEVAVLNDPRGKPELFLYGRAKEIYEKQGSGSVFVSLTHERDYAIAFVVIENNSYHIQKYC